MSPYGLGISTEQFWQLSRLEFQALRKQWERVRDDSRFMWASLQASLYNGPLDVEGMLYTADDVLGKSDRQKRKQETQQSQMAAAQANAALARMKPGEVPDDLPSWAKG